MIGAGTYRGQPLVALLLLLGGWIAMRAMVYDAAALSTPVTDLPQAAVHGAARPAVSSPLRAVAHTASAVPAPAAPLGQPGSRLPIVPQSVQPAWSVVPAPVVVPGHPPAAPVAVTPVVGTVTGHQLMFLAAVSQLPLPPVIFVPPAAGSEAGPLQAPVQTPVVRSRWSADGWLLLRGGKSRLFEGAPLASYGASQVGAVLRYRLAPGSAHRPDAYIRASSALNRRDREVSAGIAARPIARLPVVVAAEARLSDQGDSIRSRPAAFAYTELPPADLPLGLRGEAYAQVGYVGGRFATAFADGQVRVDRAVANIGKLRLRAGAGTWGGAQKGASRIDVGPAASIGIDAGPGAARLEVDWRFRIAGTAAPASGPALTLSAGF